MKNVFIILGLLMISTQTFAAGYYNYTPYTNSNKYYSTGSGYRGYNGNTGSTWTTYSDSTSARGVDSKGNNWNYNRSSGRYYNYGTGETRVHGQRMGY